MKAFGNLNSHTHKTIVYCLKYTGIFFFLITAHYCHHCTISQRLRGFCLYFSHLKLEIKKTSKKCSYILTGALTPSTKSLAPSLFSRACYTCVPSVENHFTHYKISHSSRIKNPKRCCASTQLKWTLHTVACFVILDASWKCHKHNCSVGSTHKAMSEPTLRRCSKSNVRLLERFQFFFLTFRG